MFIHVLCFKAHWHYIAWSVDLRSINAMLNRKLINISVLDLTMTVWTERSYLDNCYVCACRALPLVSSLSPWAPPFDCWCSPSACEPAASDPPALQPVCHCTLPAANTLHPQSSTACLQHPCLDWHENRLFMRKVCHLLSLCPELSYGLM